MTSSYYSYQSSPYHHNYSSNSHYSQRSPPLPLHLCFFLLILLLFLGLSWYLSYESAFEGLLDQLRLAAVLSPLVLLLAVHWLSGGGGGGFLLGQLLPARPESLHRAGGSPWGVAAVLVVLLFMVSYQSYFHECWFPLLSRR